MFGIAASVGGEFVSETVIVNDLDWVNGGVPLSETDTTTFDERPPCVSDGFQRTKPVEASIVIPAGTAPTNAYVNC